MNIKDFAGLAGVSVSTVSKIMNGKDSSISSVTRERILNLAKEYNYTPYAGVLNNTAKKSFLLGVLLNERHQYGDLLAGIMAAAAADNYNVIVCTGSDKAGYNKHLERLQHHGVDGIIWEVSPDLQPPSKSKIPLISFSRSGFDSFSLDWERFGYDAAARLIASRHKRLGFAASRASELNDLLVKGVAKCLYEHNIPDDVKQFVGSDDDSSSLLHSVTGIICCDAAITGRLLQDAARHSLSIPADLSLLLLTEGEPPAFTGQPLEALRFPYRELGRQVTEALIDKIEKRRRRVYKALRGIRLAGASIEPPTRFNDKKIVVVGSINVDTYVDIGCFPQLGETVTVNSRSDIPGGKGLNQAVGAARLGAEVVLLGRVGKDYEGGQVMNLLRENRVDVRGVSVDEHLATGHAYIYVQNDGESGIVVYEGANQNLLPDDIDTAGQLFDGASFCLVQTEVTQSTAAAAARLAKEKGVKVILKPSAIEKIDSSLLKYVDILLPNRNELKRLCPGKSRVEEQARFFLEQGISIVIVTLGRQGCYLADSQQSRYFPAADFQPVDTTGAADAFAAALAVYLSRDYDIAAAIRYANYAAGFSTLRQGVPPSLADQSILELCRL